MLLSRAGSGVDVEGDVGVATLGSCTVGVVQPMIATTPA